MDEGSRTILAIVLSMLIVLIWFKVYPKLFPPAAPPVSPSQQPVPGEKVKDSFPVFTEQKKEIGEETLSPEAKEVTIETPGAKIVFTTQGARLLHWFIKEKDDKLFDILPGKNVADLPLSLEIEGVSALGDKIFTPDREKLILDTGSQEGSLSFKYKTAEGFKIVKLFTFFSEGYLIRSEINIHNDTENKIDSNGCKISWKGGLFSEQTGGGRRQQYPVNVIACEGDKVQRKIRTGRHQISPQWAGVDSQYFLAAFIPRGGNFLGLEVKNEPTVEMGLVTSPFKLTPGEKIDYSLAIYTGPKKYSDLKKLDLHLEKSINFGTFRDIAKAMLWLLNLFARGIHNYGWAIVILGVLLQLAMAPLSFKSFKSMQAMQKVQPLIQQIQQKYKSEPRRMNAELMELYKSKKVNPLGGCLPMLLQMPIFLGLWSAFRNAFELWHTPFIFWIKDLSVHDPYYVLPIIMGGAMLFQQRLTAPPQPGPQGKMMMLMPIFFTFIFLKFPAGLVLYWLTSNLVSIGQQYMMKKIMS